MTVVIGIFVAIGVLFLFFCILALTASVADMSKSLKRMANIYCSPRTYGMDFTQRDGKPKG